MWLPHNHQQQWLSSKHTSVFGEIFNLKTQSLYLSLLYKQCISAQYYAFHNKLISQLPSYLLLHFNYLKLPSSATKARAAINRMQTKLYTVMQFQKHDLRT